MNKIQQAYIRYKQRRILRRKLAYISALVRLCNSHSNLVVRYEEQRCVLKIKQFAIERKAIKVAKPTVKESLKEIIDADKQMQPLTHQSSASDEKLFKKQESAPMKAAIVNPIIEPVVVRS